MQLSGTAPARIAHCALALGLDPATFNMTALAAGEFSLYGPFRFHSCCVGSADHLGTSRFSHRECLVSGSHAHHRRI